MAREFEVSFDFEETVSLQSGYKLKRPSQEDATELVIVIACGIRNPGEMCSFPRRFTGEIAKEKHR